MQVDLASREEQLDRLKLTLEDASRSAALSDAEIARLHRESAIFRAMKEEADASFQREVANLNEHNSNLSEMWHGEQKLGAELRGQLAAEALRYKEQRERLTEEEQRNSLLTAETQLLQAQVSSTMERNQTLAHELEEAHTAISAMHQAICDGGGKLRAFSAGSHEGGSGSSAVISPRLQGWGGVGLILSDPEINVDPWTDVGSSGGGTLQVEKCVNIADMFLGAAASRCRPVICVGDSILRVDTVDVQGQSGREVRQMLDGAIGSTVTLTNWSRQRRDTYTVTMTRSHLPSIASSGNRPRIYASDLENRSRDVFDEVLALSEALLEEKDNFEEFKLQSNADQEALKMRLASVEEEADGMRATHASLTSALDVQTEELAAYKKEIYAVTDEQTLLRCKLEEAEHQVLHHSARLLQLHNHIQDVEDRLQDAVVGKRKLTLRVVTKVRHASLQRAFLVFRQAVYTHELLLQAGGKTIDVMKNCQDKRSRIRSAFAALATHARYGAHARKAVDSATGTRGLGRLQREHMMRQRSFAAWKQGTDHERYAALETVHRVALQRLMVQNKDEAPDVCFDPVVAPRAKRALLHATRDSMTIHTRPPISREYSSGGESSEGSGSDEGVQSRHSHLIGEAREKARKGPARASTGGVPNHRATARVLHTQLATAQLARVFQTIVKSREQRWL